jgi:probable O-glycosylation ligase (exosortase A-associated)
VRDLIVFAFVFGSIPLMFRRPYIGVLVWSVLAYLNPHRFTWGPAYDFRFSLVVGAALILAVVISREPKRIPWTPVTCLWLLFFAWTYVTTVFALDPEAAAYDWSRWWKINLASFFTLLVMQRRERLHLLAWVIVISLGFYGVKGGLFTILTGGGYRVWGPPGSFIEENNALGLAMIMVVPLMRYLQLETNRRWVKLALSGSMVFTIFAILGTQSRGAFLGLAAMGAFLVWKSPSRWKVAAIAVVLIPVVLAFMPSTWHSRMDTISTYEQDASAMGRINAWWFAFRLAQARPILGGGFNTFSEELFAQYAPNPQDVHDAHSIYFEVLAEHSFLGLTLFLLLGFATLATCRRVAELTRNRPEVAWAKNLCGMAQVSLIGYAISGAFLGLAYFDLVYCLIAICVLTRLVVERELAEGSVSAASSPAGPMHERPPQTSTARTYSREARLNTRDGR